MEVMEASLDHLYKKLKPHDESIPEDVLGRIVLSVSQVFLLLGHIVCVIFMNMKNPLTAPGYGRIMDDR